MCCPFLQLGQRYCILLGRLPVLRIYPYKDTDFRDTHSVVGNNIKSTTIATTTTPQAHTTPTANIQSS